MNKERILAARKRLKEFQRIKKDQINKNIKEYTDPKKENGDQKLSFENSSDQHELQPLESNDNKNDEMKITNINNTEYINNFITSENITNQNICIDQKSINDTVKIPLYNNGLEDYSINENKCTIPSEMIHENVDQNDDLQNFSIKQFEHSNLDSNLSSKSFNSLQKEHLLQMANAVADVLVNETTLDETSLNNCDLEQKNQFLNCCLEEQKKVVSQLHIQVSQSTSRISELEAIINNKDTEFESRFIREINPLKEQVQLDAQTIGILVAEKAELTATNLQYQTTIKQKTDELAKLSENFKISQQRVSDLQMDLNSVKSNMEDFTKSYQNLQINYAELDEKIVKLKKENENLELETSELRQKYNYKKTELTNLQQELQEKCALLSLSELRNQQLSNYPQEINLLETQHHTTKVLEQQLSQMKETLENINSEKEEVSKKYQNYIQQLDERHAKLVAELDTSKKVIIDSEIREQSYIQRLSEMEQQLQKEKAKSIKPNEDQSEKIEALTKSIDNLVLEQENLQLLLNDKDNEIETLKNDLKELQDIREQNVTASKLATALQSEQLGASRAVSQNQQLKTQLDEMNDAFIALSNTKLDLTERVQAERTISRKLNAQLNDLELQVEELKKQLSEKEAALIELKKEKLHTIQIEDQIQHYQAQSHNANTLQQELKTALITIENLKKDNQVLRLKLDEMKGDNITNTETSQVINEAVVDGTFKVDTENLGEKCQDNDTDNDSLKNQSLILSENSTIANVPESVKKLEIRFKETMERIAELTDEKQRLEHLVLQLQGETETIGEYVTLYQKQRTILQEKAKEKENTFCQLLEQRNQQQEQLHKLKVLVAQLLKSRNDNASKTTPSVVDETKAESNDSEIIGGHMNKLDDASHKSDKTTSQILDLLTEIKDCNNTCFLQPNFHPCPWCSGKLITI